MRRPAAAALLAVVLVLSASPVAAHGNHVEADSQRSADGTVYVEAVRPLSDGFLVLHRQTTDGEFGEPIGHTAVDVDDGFQRNVPVRMDDAAWRDWPASATVWIVYHADDGDGEFRAADDPATQAFGRVTGRTITLAKADRPARVLAERSAPQRTTTTTATVGSVAMPTDGFLVLRTGDATNGSVVGTTPLSAGVHDNVTLAVDESAFPDNESTIGLYATMHADDGDGNFTASDDVVRAGTDPVTTYFLVWHAENATNTPTTQVVQTPSMDDAVVTPTAEQATGGTDSTTASEFGTSVPGYGVGHAALAVVVAAALLLARPE
ncbi:MAG: hypothetical protein ABEH83_13800 [Halobacterium sp.]